MMVWYDGDGYVYVFDENGGSDDRSDDGETVYNCTYSIQYTIHLSSGGRITFTVSRDEI